MAKQLKKPSFVDIWWSVGQEFESLPPVDPAFNRQNMGMVRRVLLRAAALPMSYRRSDFSRLATVDGQRAGYLYARQRGEALHIDSLGVAASSRRRGLARDLLHSAREYARTRHLRYLTAAVTPENEPARALFDIEGFRPHRQFRARLDGTLPQESVESFRIEELSAAETLPAFERWKKTAVQASDPWAADLVLDVYLRSGWRGAARHWSCFAGEQEAGYLRVAGLTGNFEVYLAVGENYWENPGQLTWLREALGSYPAEVQQIILETAGDRQFEVSRSVWEAAGFAIEPRPRYLLVSELQSEKA